MDEDRPESAAKTSEEIAELLAFFSEKLSTYRPEEKERILAAADWALKLHGEQKRASGDPYIVHPLNVASILVDIQMDAQAVIAALLHDVLEDTETSRVGLRKTTSKRRRGNASPWRPSTSTLLWPGDWASRASRTSWRT
jgi:(p)ppGpp synthase/HD superfamily hydrolase